MRTRASIILLTAYILSFHLLTFAAVGQTQRDEKADAGVEISPSVVSVTSYDANGDVVARGAGFFVSEIGDVLTRGTLIPPQAARIEIKTSDGKTHQVRGVIAKDEKTDLVTVSLQNPLPGAKPLPSATFSPEFGDPVFAIEGDVEGKQKLVEGVVTAVDRVTTGKRFRVAVPLKSILSGSPVINAKGEVVGVAISLDEGRQGFTAQVLITEASLYPRGADFQPLGVIREELPSGVVRRTPALLQGTAITRVAPAYPPFAKAEGVEGTVIVGVLVGEDGNVLSAQPVSFKFHNRNDKSKEVSDFAAAALKQAAVEAALQWKFAPTTFQGKPIKVRGTLTVNFHL